MSDSDSDSDSMTDLKEFTQRIKQRIVRPNRKSTEQPTVCSPDRDPTNLDATKNLRQPQMWAISGDCFLPCEAATKILPAGYYMVESSMEKGLYFKKIPINTDELLELPDSEMEIVLQEVKNFWKLEDHFRKFKFLFKRGVLLWGPAGSGKTSLVQMISKRVVEEDNIAVFIDHPGIATVGLSLLRAIEPKRRIVAILEDIDAIVRNHGEKHLLSFLDGEQQIDNVLCIATTNYPEQLDPRIINRPSRFDRIMKVGMPKSAARRQYLEIKNKRLTESNGELEAWVKKTNGYSLAHLKELIISVEVLQCDFNETIDRLNVMMECDSHSKEFLGQKFQGFGLGQQPAYD